MANAAYTPEMEPEARALICAKESIKNCYHCGLTIEPQVKISSTHHNKDLYFCCQGCKAVCDLILAGGLENYYRHRSEFAEKPENTQSKFLEFDNSVFQASFCRSIDPGIQQASLYIEGIHCAACVWLLEQALNSCEGVSSASVSLVDNEAEVCWQSDDQKLSNIVQLIHQLGYRALPWSEDTNQRLQGEAEQTLLRRTGLAGLIMMQVGMFSIALYASGPNGMASEYKDLLHGFSLLLSTVLLLYSGRIFFQGAWRSMKRWRVSMDVPIALALTAAWTGSVVNTVRGSGDVYFDSICMFVFLLSGVRYLELKARNRYAHLDQKGDLPPNCKILQDKENNLYSFVALQEIKIGDLIYVQRGEMIPVDGRLESESALVNEANISGEFLPVEKVQGQRVLSGSINQSNNLILRADKISENSCLQNIKRFSRQTKNQQTRFLASSDLIAQYFSFFIVVATALVSIVWYWLDPARVLEIDIAMLVITCPCALSLAAPSAFTVAANYLRKKGIIICNKNTLEKIKHIDQLAFDKTGTLTEGRFTLKQSHYFDNPHESVIDSIAFALQSWSEHPLAHAFQFKNDLIKIEKAASHTSAGVSALITDMRLPQSNIQQGEFRIGSRHFCAELYKGPLPDVDTASSLTTVWLVNATQCLACYELEDSLRADALLALNKLHRYSPFLISGDNAKVVEKTAHELGLNEWYSGCSPSEKLKILQEKQAKGHKLLMVGDGVNDLPVLAKADVSVAMNSANKLAQVEADCILLNNKISDLTDLIASANFTFKIMRQNYSWALLYNMLALPLAAMGLVPPWLAALGMSTSSLIVVLNAARIYRQQPTV